MNYTLNHWNSEDLLNPNTSFWLPCQQSYFLLQTFKKLRKLCSMKKRILKMENVREFNTTYTRKKFGSKMQLMQFNFIILWITKERGEKSIISLYFDISTRHTESWRNTFEYSKTNELEKFSSINLILRGGKKKI